MSIGFIFIDGFGMGDDDPETNPFFHAQTPFLDKLLQGFRLTRVIEEITMSNYRIIPTDANLDTAGLPQSATGQTSLLTGKNAAQIIGRHLNGYPSPNLVNLINEQNILKYFVNSGADVILANAYSPEYFEMIETGKRKHAAIAIASMSANLPFLSIDDMCQGNAVYQDITNRLLIDRGHQVNRRTPNEAGKLMAKIIENHDFTMFEYFQSDIIGHKQCLADAVEIIETLDAFMGSLMNTLSWADNTIIITSDHGNIENYRIKTHTRNPVPTMVLGDLIGVMREKICSITDVFEYLKLIHQMSKEKRKVNDS